MANPHRQQPLIQPGNPVEAGFLQNCKFYNSSENIFIADINMQSAWEELNLLEASEQMWPSKTIIEEREVTHTLPRSTESIKTTVYRKKRVPMTPEEAQELAVERAKALMAAQAGKGAKVDVKKQADGLVRVKVTKKTKKATKKATNSKGTKK